MSAGFVTNCIDEQINDVQELARCDMTFFTAAGAVAVMHH